MYRRKEKGSVAPLATFAAFEFDRNIDITPVRGKLEFFKMVEQYVVFSLTTSDVFVDVHQMARLGDLKMYGGPEFCHA